MNLRELEYLVAVDALGSFTKAAKHCHVGQSTLSIQIKKLESYLGVPVFERSNKKVILTTEGAVMVASAKRILNEVQAIKDYAKHVSSPHEGVLRVGAFPTIASYFFPAFVVGIQTMWPSWKIFLVEEKTDDLLMQLKEGIIDCAVLALPVEEDVFEYHLLFEDVFYLAVPKNHRLADRSSVCMVDLKKDQLMLLTEGHCLRAQALEVCAFSAVKETDFRATSLETLREMVRVGSGITLMPKIAVKNDKGIVYVPFSKPAPARKVALVWRKTSFKKDIFEELWVLGKRVFENA